MLAHDIDGFSMKPSSTWGLVREVATEKKQHMHHASSYTLGQWFHPQTSLKPFVVIILLVSNGGTISEIAQPVPVCFQVNVWSGWSTSYLWLAKVKRSNQFGVWVCLKMGYRSCGMLLIGKMILWTIGILGWNMGFQNFETTPCIYIPSCTIFVANSTSHP